MPKRSFYRTPFWNQRVHGSQTVTISARRLFYPDFSLMQEKLCQKRSLLVISEIVGLFGKRLAADHMYSLHNWDKFMQQVQTPLSRNIQKMFDSFFDFKNLHEIQRFSKNKISSIAILNILEVTDSEKCGYLNARTLVFWNTLPESISSRVANTDKI